MAYACGSGIKFYNSETKETTTFLPPNLTTENETNSICLLTANSSVNKFAFSETKLSPNVFIYDYGSTIKQQSVLSSSSIDSNFLFLFKAFKLNSIKKDGAQIEYLMIEFSNSEAILTLSAVPDLQLIVW